MIRHFLNTLEMLGGSKDMPARWRKHPIGQLLLGLWWASLAAIILSFCGQASKFIYIDF